MSRSPLRPIYVVSKKEFKTNLLSVRMAILVSILALVVVGGSYGFAGLSTIPQPREQFVLWVHPVVQEDQMGVAAFVSDAWGVPHGDAEVELIRQDPETGTKVTLDTQRTDEDGFARFFPLSEGSYDVSASMGLFTFIKSAWLSSDFPYGNLSFDTESFDLDDSGLTDDLAIHFMDISGGIPEGVKVFSEDELVDPPDSRGFLSLKLPREGMNNVTIEYGGKAHQVVVFVRESFEAFDPFAEGPDFILFFIALTFGTLLLPIAGIALGYYSVSKEKVGGSAELLLYRPASWRAVAVGKFLGVFTAIALPVAAVILSGVLIIIAVTGTWPTAMVTLGFVVFSLFILAVYILLMQSISTVAKTAGTAIIFGILLFFLFSFLWSVVVFLVTTLVGAPFGSREYFVLASYLGLGNPSSIYGNLFILVAPEGFEVIAAFAGISGSLFALPNWVPAVSAAVWLAVLFLLFLEIYKRKAAG